MNTNRRTSLRARCLGALILASNVGAGTLCLPLLAQTAAPKTPARPATGIAAEVNGEKISNADVERQLTRIRAAQPPLQANTLEARQALQDIRGNLIESLIDFRLEVQEAKKLHLAALPAQVDTAVADYRKRFKTDKEMKEALVASGKSPADFRVLISDGIMVDALESRWTTPVAISEAELGEAYRANIDQFAAPEEVRARHILISFGAQAPTPEDKAKSLKKAQDLLAKVKAPGADFGLLARENSDDPGSKATGGELGSFARGTMVPTFEAAAFGAKVGEVVGPVESPFGYHLIKVEAKTPARTIPLDLVREEFRTFLLQKKREKTVFDNIAALRTAAKIKKSS